MINDMSHLSRFHVPDFFHPRTKIPEAPMITTELSLVRCQIRS